MMKQIALSKEQMQHLIELGVDCSNASMEWVEIPTAESILKGKKECEWILVVKPNDKDCIPAFTLQDIIEILPEQIKDYEFSIYYGKMVRYDKIDCFDRFEVLYEADDDTLLNNAYAMLCWCAEKGYLKQK